MFDFDTKYRKLWDILVRGERERVCICVCERERVRERKEGEGV